MTPSFLRPTLASLLCFALSVAAQNDTDADDGYPNDPVLQYRPNFARSLPVQILVTGVVLTLVAVLLIHLLFTIQYHWTLAQVNYILQLSGVSTLLISLVATLHVVLAQSVRESKQWPYMLSYIAVDTPPLDDDDTTWTTIEQVTWIVMNATTAVLIQITHIHFLTLLYPSRLEAKLIYILLGPLALLSAVAQLYPIQAIGSMQLDEDNKLVYFTDAIRNICNATLSFLFAASLFIWGFLINRKQAWRTDGGTAAFGMGALTLAIMSTALNIIYIPTGDQYVWLPGLMWAVVLWQSFLGWWWWVGAGMGVGEVDELLKREEKKERRRKLKKEKRRAQREKARMMWKGVTGAFTYRGKDGKESDDESIMGDNSDGQNVHQEGSSTAMEFPHSHTISDSITTTGTSSSSASSTAAGSPYARMKNSRAGRCINRWFDTVRLAHLTAARDQAAERVERIQQVYRRDAIVRYRAGGATGWGSATENDSVEEEDDDKTLTDVRIGPVAENMASPRVEAAIAGERIQPSSFWWWGPLRRWRLQDATVY